MDKQQDGIGCFTWTLVVKEYCVLSQVGEVALQLSENPQKFPRPTKFILNENGYLWFT